MKHIKRKFLLTHNISTDGYEYMLEQIGQIQKTNNLSTENKVPHLITSTQKFIQGFFYNLEGNQVVIPEPNPIIIYFSNAQGFLSVILETRERLFKILKTPDLNIGDVLNDMFAFYGCIVNFISSLFDALEGFVNSKIPKDYTCINPKRRGKTMNKYQIIRYTNFEDKVKTILPDIYIGANFATEKSHLFANLKLLQTIRDNITHAKADIGYDVNYYKKLFTEALDFDYLKSIESAKDFINFYEKDLIEQCDCGKSH